MPHVVWSRRANADLDRLYEFVAKKNRTAALNAILHIQAEVETLEYFPRLGRLSASDLRELIVPFGKGAYHVLYAVEPERVEVLSIRHSRELEYPQGE